MGYTSQAGKKFNQYHPQVQKALKKVALDLLLSIREQAKTDKSISFPIISDIEVYAKKEGRIIHPVLILDSRVNCMTSGQPIVDTSRVRAILAADQMIKTSTMEAHA
jgi:hypothetical protein